MPGARLDEERHVAVYTQSWLADFMRCPERAWHDWRHPVRTFNDATAVGQALHAFMEARMAGKSYVDAREDALRTMHRCIGTEGFQHVKVMTVETMAAHLMACLRGMDAAVVPQVACGGEIERSLCHMLTQAGEWQIMLEGTPDYVDPFGHIWDWKSAGSEYNAYETALWAVQPTAYTYLVSRESREPRHEFTYAVAIKPHGEIQTIEVERSARDWAWLGRVARGALNLMRHQPEGDWPVNHTHYLCSPKWCPAWDECRGLYVQRIPVTTQANGASQ